jgi:large subunit ribosomal protein L2
MGKRILQQRAGKGGIQFRARTKGKIAPVKYPKYVLHGAEKAVITAILDERGRTAPLMQIRSDGDCYTYLPAFAGAFVGKEVFIGPEAKPETGNILPLASIPEGTRICNIELRPGDGGKLVRASGTSAILFSKTQGNALVKLPSGKSILLDERCRATVGEIAGAGRKEKPFLKSGTRHHAMRAMGRVYPRVRGVAMAVVYHPFGGGRHQHPGKSTSTARNTPPGRKVGLIAPRKTGRKRLARATIEVK